MQVESIVRQPKLDLLSSGVICGVVIVSLGFVLPAADAKPIYTVLHSFHGKPSDGALAAGSLVRDRDGNLFGTTTNGGSYTLGTVFKIDTSGQETVLTNFKYANGQLPAAGLTKQGGTLYDTAPGGGFDGGGAVLKINRRGGKASLLYSFCSLANCADGFLPTYGVAPDVAGNLYGTTANGGAYNNGVIFKVDSTGTETVLYSFCPSPDANGNCSDGAVPIGGVVRDSAGNLYGTAQSGPASADCVIFNGSGFPCGVVWKLDTSGNESVLHAFTGPPNDGSLILGQLTIDEAGNLYGTTNAGGSGTACGSSGCGTVFKVDSSGNETILHSFDGADGQTPVAQGLVLDQEGNIYGTASAGGAHGHGTVFKLSASGKFKVLYSFRGKSDGADPEAGLLLDGGVLYGEAKSGGDLKCSENPGGGCGVVFKIAP